MLCAISGEAPQVPVASKKSGRVFEKRLIEAHVLENGTDPITSEELSIDDLIDLQSSHIVRPRPPTLTSIPSLLSVFQNEWDALALETFSLKQQLVQTTQELSTALYQHDAAIRVIARLTRERDEARDALSKLSINGTMSHNENAMQVDRQWLSEGLIAKITATHAKLSSSRRKRVAPADWATAETIESFKPKKAVDAIFSGSRSIALNSSSDLLLLGGEAGSANVVSIPSGEIVHVLDVSNGTVTDGAWLGNRAIVATSTGTVGVFEDGAELMKFTHHAGEASAVALHPCGQIVASVGVDKSFVFYDLESSSVVGQIFTSSALTTAAFHPDGHIFAAGASDGQVKLYDVKSGNSLANLDAGGQIQSLSFSENGYWLAITVTGATSIQVWDLRKDTVPPKLLEIGTAISQVGWDYTGQFLFAVGSGGVAVQQYTKATKTWNECLRNSADVLAAVWGAQGRSLLCLARKGSITELS